MDTIESFHLFGGCTIEEPSAAELAEASRYLQLMSTCKPLTNQTAKKWNLNFEFERMVQIETDAWKELGVVRPSHLLRPSGDINSPLAIHTLNPTYFVADPESTVTDDPTNPTIRDLNTCGLSSENCFMFDELCRRDRSDQVVFLYPEKIRRIHHNFAREVRQNMSAVVEICFGDHVFKEVSRSSNLVRFPLWGKFRPVKLWLELDEHNPAAVKRLVIQAFHPQFFHRKSSLKRLGPFFDETYRKPQGLSILMAIQLADLSRHIATGSYLLSDRFSQRRSFPCLSTEQDARRKTNDKLALIAFQTACPDKFEQYQKRQSRTKEEKRFLDKLNGIESLVLESIAKEVTPNQKLSSSEQIIRLNHRKVCLQRLIWSFDKLREDLDTFPDYAEDAELFHSKVLDFNEVPVPLIQWLADQDGLKIRGKPVESRDSLELVFFLLREEPYPQVEQLPSAQIARMVASLYVQKVTQLQLETGLRREICIPAEPGKIVQLDCSKCKRPALDDAYPFVCLDCPSLYVIHEIRFSKYGCGQRDCPGGGCTGIMPKSRVIQDYTRLTRKEMALTVHRKQSPRCPKWKRLMLRTGEELRECASIVRLSCRNCGYQKEYTTPSWTIHSPSRLVIPQLKCVCSSKDCYFYPLDKTIPTISNAVLVKVHQGFLKVGCNLEDYPRIPSIIFETTTTRGYAERFILLKEAKEAQEKSQRLSL